MLNASCATRGGQSREALVLKKLAAKLVVTLVVKLVVNKRWPESRRACARGKGGRR